MNYLSIIALFSITAICEILGCYSIYAWLRLGKTAWLILVALVFLGLFAWLLTFHPSHTGRVYASYGGVYVAVSVLWLWLFEKQTPDAWDLIGSGIALIGMAIIAFGPHKINH